MNAIPEETNFLECAAQLQLFDSSLVRDESGVTSAFLKKLVQYPDVVGPDRHVETLGSVIAVWGHLPPGWSAFLIGPPSILLTIERDEVVKELRLRGVRGRVAAHVATMGVHLDAELRTVSYWSVTAPTPTSFLEMTISDSGADRSLHMSGSSNLSVMTLHEAYWFHRLATEVTKFTQLIDARRAEDDALIEKMALGFGLDLPCERKGSEDLVNDLSKDSMDDTHGTDGPVKSSGDIDAHRVQVYSLDAVNDALSRMKFNRPDRDDFESRRKALGLMAKIGPMRPLVAPRAGEDLSSVREACPNFEPVIDDVRRRLAIAKAGRGVLRLDPILLAGEPGVGKTHFARELARVLGCVFRFVPMNTTSTGWVLTGLDSSWRGGKPGVVAESIALGDSANPIFLLDEIDKCAGDKDHDPSDALLQLLEPSTAKTFVDEFLGVELDASHAFWICTANDLRALSEPMLSRLRVYEIDAPTEDERASIISRMHRAALRDFGLNDFDDSLRSEVTSVLIKESLRDCKRLIADAIGRAIEDGRREITVDDVVQRPTRKRSVGFL
jgi:ATP-dependent Lon protease